MTYNIVANTEYPGSNEVYFDCKPSEEVRTALKSLKMRWHNKKSCWYGFVDVSAIESAISGTSPAAAQKERKPASKKQDGNKYGIKVGDVFCASWGWEQTNVDFFQVVSLIGSATVKIVHVYPEVLESEATGPMAENRIYKIPDSLLPARSCVLTDDNDGSGVTKRVLPGYGDTEEEQRNGCYIKLTSYANAYRVTTPTIKQYVSWYA